MTAKRYHDLDALRAFAMLLGIVLHGLLSFVGWPIWPVQDINQSKLYFIPLMFIHGFRMSLFFFVSGFFTMMMWQKRGTGGLLVHRAKRIVLPFFVLGLLLFPMLNNMPAFADWVGEEEEGKSVAPEEGKESFNLEYKAPDDLGGAARLGDLESIERHLAEGAKIDGKYDKGFTPLHWAAAMGKPDAVNLLIEKGADLNVRDEIQSTPILVAAFFGRAECVHILLEKEADPQLKNIYKDRPLEAVMADQETTLHIAKNILLIPINWTEVREGRKEVRHLLGEGDQPTAVGTWFARNYKPDGSFITHHLWFLYDLVYLVIAFVLVASALKFVPMPKLAKWLAESPLRLLWLVPLTCCAQYFMKEEFGPATSVLLEPDWIKLGYYGIFFGYGALCSQHKGFHEKAGRYWLIHFLVAVLVFVPAAFFIMVKQDLEFRYEIISLCSALFVWLMIFGLIGLFRQFFSGESSKVRFVSDSAYWLYIAHLPVIQVVQIWVSQWPVPSVFKLVFVCVITTALLLFSYRYLIRYTPVGTMLNGKRTLPSPG